ncbi:hypothetical protein [Nocardia sp. NPDC050710]|uniref:hypothetical protein n=1 Tax=Nocardia sp. NPDC050710 TaxID=3157220 RepID=UPI0033D76C41
MSPVQTTAPQSVAELLTRAADGRLGPDPATLTISNAFLTRYDTRHRGSRSGYHNAVLGLRTGAAVGSCSVEPAADNDELLNDCVGVRVADLLRHPLLPVRIAALDAYLMHLHPHPAAAGAMARAVAIEPGDSLTKSRQRARAVVALLPARTRRVLVVGVVGSLLAALRERGITYLPCDFAGGTTEWGEPVHRDLDRVARDYDAMLVTGMTLGNGSFDALAAEARDRSLPLVAYAQSGSAVLPWFLGAGVYALSAEPYPFFSLDGGPSTLFHYRGEVDA